MTIPVLLPRVPRRRPLARWAAGRKDGATQGAAPRADAAEGEARHHAPAEIPAAGDLVLLIVDDDPLMTDMLPRKLRRVMSERVRIVTAASVVEAEALLASEPPHIVLSDYNLRDLKNGLDILSAAARVSPAGLRILFSGHARHEIGPRLDQAPVHSYLEKPMRLDELVEAILRTIHERCGVDLAREGRDDGAR